MIFHGSVTVMWLIMERLQILHYLIFYFLVLQAVIIFQLCLSIPVILIVLAYKSITHKEGRETCMSYVGDKFM
jgi:hypothetical protein